MKENAKNAHKKELLSTPHSHWTERVTSGKKEMKRQLYELYGDVNMLDMWSVCIPVIVCTAHSTSSA